MNYTSWANRFFVLTESALTYYEREEKEGEASSQAPKGSIPLKNARVFSTMWAPEGLFGWMVATESDKRFPFRCFTLKERDTWLGYLLALPSLDSGVRNSIHSVGGGFGAGAAGRAEGPEDREAVAELDAFMAQCGLAHVLPRLKLAGVTSMARFS